LSSGTAPRPSWVSQRIPVGDPLNPFVSEHNRHYGFRWLAVLGKEFSEEFAGAFARFTSSYAPATGKAQHKAIKSLMRWLIARPEAHSDLFGRLRTNWISVPESTWHKALYHWHSFYVGASRPDKVTKGNTLNSINTVWAGLYRRGIVAEVKLRLPKTYRRGSRAKRTLAEVAVVPPSTRDEEAVTSLLKRLPAEDRKSPQTRDFLRVLVQEVGEIPTSPTQLADEVSRILNSRLAGLRSVFESVLIEDYSRFCRAEAMVRDNQHRLDELRAAFRRDDRGDVPCGVWNHRRGSSLNAILRDPGEIGGLANLLTFVDSELGGLPRGSLNRRTIEFGRICARFGGITAVHHHLNASTRTLLAAVGLILVDTGFNVASVLDADEDCLRPSERSGYRELHVSKNRGATNRPVAHVPVKAGSHEISVPKAVEIIREMTRRDRLQATGPTKEKLFIRRMLVGRQAGAVLPLSGESLSKSFRTMLSRCSEGLPRYTLDMIRPTVLLSSTYASHGGLAIAQALAFHTETNTTEGYARRWIVRVQWQATMRKFQELFQIVAIYHIEDAVEQLGLTVEQATALFEEAQKSGLSELAVLARNGRTGRGVSCKDPTGGVQPGTVPGEPCSMLENCMQPDPDLPLPRCRNVFVIATEENVADMILFLEYLKVHREWMEANRPERWETVWIPWFVLAEVVLGRMRRGPLAAVLRRATTLADERRKSAWFPPLH
jgi:hypothetical protein